MTGPFEGGGERNEGNDWEQPGGEKMGRRSGEGEEVRLENNGPHTQQEEGKERLESLRWWNFRLHFRISFTLTLNGEDKENPGGESWRKVELGVTEDRDTILYKGQRLWIWRKWSRKVREMDTWIILELLPRRKEKDVMEIKSNEKVCQRKMGKVRVEGKRTNQVLRWRMGERGGGMDCERITSVENKQTRPL